MSQYQSSLKFKNYIVEKVSFEINRDYTGNDTDTVYDFNNFISEEENSFVQHLEVIIFPDAKERDYPFTMNVQVAGLFEICGSYNDDIKNDFLNKNSIAILYPYLRALTSVYSSNANIGTLVLPVINVVKYLEDKKKSSNK